MDEKTLQELLNRAESGVKVWKTMEGNPYIVNTMIVLSLIDMVAAQDGKTGFEFVCEYLPMIKEVSDELGVAS